MAFPVPCPGCRRLVGWNAVRCPHCGLLRPGERWRRRFATWLDPDPAAVVRTIITVNVVMFGLSLVVDPRGMGRTLNPLAFLSPSDRALFVLGATGSLPLGHLGRWWSLVAAGYLHGGLLHLFFNMAALAQLGPFVAREYGPARMFTIYTLGGMAGFLVSWAAGVPFTIGASASVLALVGAGLQYGLARGGFYGRAVFRQLWGWTVGIFLFGLLVPGINNWAHAGGLGVGFALGWLLGFRERVRETPFHRVLGLVCALLTAAVLLWAVAGAVAWRLGI